MGNPPKRGTYRTMNKRRPALLVIAWLGNDESLLSLEYDEPTIGL